MNRAVAALAGLALPLAVAAAAFTVAVGLPAGDPDMWWHLASGRWMVEHREELRVDVFSATAAGEPYALGEWLGEVVLYLAYAGGSWTGVAILRAALVAAAAFAVTRLALRTAPARVAIPLAAAALVLSKPTWTDRPQLFTLALFPLVLDLCLTARSGSRAALVAIVPVLAVWAELHGGFALGIALVWIFAIEAVVERRALAGPLAVAVIATAVVNAEPGPLSLLRAATHVAGSSVRILEETPVDPLTPFGALFALFVGATFALALVRGGSLLGALVLVPMLWLALAAQRHIPLFGFATVPFLAAPLTSLIGEVGTTLRRASAGLGLLRPTLPRSPGGDAPSRLYAFLNRFSSRSNRSGSISHASSKGAELQGAERAARVPKAPPPPSSKSYPLRRSLPIGIAAALWLGALASIATAAPGPDLKPYPDGARTALASTSGILLNEYDWGGYLIWSVPTRPVFVDGRLYPFNGNGVMQAYHTAVHVLPSWRGVIERWNVGQALLRPDRALVQALQDDGWTVRARDERFVLLERPR